MDPAALRSRVSSEQYEVLLDALNEMARRLEVSDTHPILVAF